MSLSNSEIQIFLCSPCRLRALTDAELMDALHSGCNDALATLFERHGALVFQIARGSVCSDGEAEATVRRVFGSIFQAKDEFNSDRDSFTTWLLKQAEPGPGSPLA
jgi:DNA-directed RNA polymerase specialized sigma24 family protein